MSKIHINTKKCKGCFLCVSVCPAKAINPSGELGDKGYETVVAEQDKCIGCGSCYRMCPDLAIQLYD